ncbi:MAG: response regulator [Chloroflexi bacterium]|nr:response regulator [Chloroflexota bacterium]
MSTPRILVVDDDEGIGEFVGLALSDEGYEVATALHGAVALEVIGRQAPDVILLDMRMPIMDGWEFARRYRERPGPHAPIVVMTAARDAATRASEIEADGVLAKPFDLDALLEIVARFTPRPGRPAAS